MNLIGEDIVHSRSSQQLPRLGLLKRFVRCGALGAEVPGNRRTTDSNLDCAFVENTLAFIDPKTGGLRSPFNPHAC